MDRSVPPAGWRAAGAAAHTVNVALKVWVVPSAFRSIALTVCEPRAIPLTLNGNAVVVLPPTKSHGANSSRWVAGAVSPLVSSNQKSTQTAAGSASR